MGWLDGITDAMDMNLGNLLEMWKDRWTGMLQSMESQKVGHNWETEQPQNGYCQNYFSNSPLMTQYLFVLVNAIDLTLSFGKIRMT